MERIHLDLVPDPRTEDGATVVGAGIIWKGKVVAVAPVPTTPLVPGGAFLTISVVI